jgi:hypothetical protein
VESELPNIIFLMSSDHVPLQFVAEKTILITSTPLHSTSKNPGNVEKDHNLLVVCGKPVKVFGVGWQVVTV